MRLCAGPILSRWVTSTNHPPWRAAARVAGDPAATDGTVSAASATNTWKWTSAAPRNVARKNAAKARATAASRRWRRPRKERRKRCPPPYPSGSAAAVPSPSSAGGTDTGIEGREHQSARGRRRRPRKERRRRSRPPKQLSEAATPGERRTQPEGLPRSPKQPEGLPRRERDSNPRKSFHPSHAFQACALGQTMRSLLASKIV